MINQNNQNQNQNENQFDLNTQLLHLDRQNKSSGFGAIHAPIHTSVQYGFERVEDLIGVFQGTVSGGFNYARQGTPTIAALESKITHLEDGFGSICFATGMASICAIFLTLLKSGDHLICSRFVFGNTNSVLGTLADLGIEVTCVDVTDFENVQNALRPNTKMVFVETIANPATQIPDLQAIGDCCAKNRLLYVVDNTIASPFIFQAKTVQASLVVNSLTKSLSGHGNALGGSITDTGLFDWSVYANIHANYRKGDSRAFGLQQLRKKGLRDMGGTLSSHAAHAISVGMETAALRLKHSSQTALALAKWLEKHPKIARVNYPMLENHPQFLQAKKHFKDGLGSWLLSFELHDETQCLPLCNALSLPIKATGLGDTRSLIIPVAHTIFWEAGEAVRAQMNIGESMIRFSVGLENESDLIADFERALDLL